MYGYTENQIMEMTETKLIDFWRYGYQYNIEVRHGKIEKDVTKKKTQELTKEELQAERERLKKLYNYKG